MRCVNDTEGLRPAARRGSSLPFILKIQRRFAERDVFHRFEQRSSAHLAWRQFQRVRQREDGDVIRLQPGTFRTHGIVFGSLTVVDTQLPCARRFLLQLGDIGRNVVNHPI